MAPDTAAYDHLDNPQEREWLTGLDPQAVLVNAHRMYDWMREQGVGADSYLRELAFTKAANTLGLDYEVLYNAWLNDTPLGVQSEGCPTCGSNDTEHTPGEGCSYLPVTYKSQAARDAQARNYGKESYWQYLDEAAQRAHDSYMRQGNPEKAAEMFTRSLSASLVGNDGD